MSNSMTTSTTKQNTTIDAVFTRNIDNLTSNVYVSFFSYHKPIVSTIREIEN